MPTANSSPHEIARETLRRMATKREPPTPDNYRRTYSDVSGQPEAESTLTPTNWLGLLRTLTRQISVSHQGITSTQKKQAIDQLLEAGPDAPSPDKSYAALNRLARQWSRLQPAPDATTARPLDKSPPGATATPASAEVIAALTELFAQALERGVASRLALTPDLLAETRKIAGNLRAARDYAAVSALAGPLKQLWYKLSLRGDDEDTLRQGLLRVLSLLIENIQEITTDDQWLSGQMAAVKTIISAPLSLQSLELIERSLRETIVRQGILRHSLTEAKDRLKEMASSFINRIGELSTMTGDYHDKIDVLAGKLRKTDDLGELGSVLDEIMVVTRQIQNQALQSRDNLSDAQRMVQLAEQRIRQLEAELEQAGEKVREDQLTGTLNRRGLDEAFDREISIRQRNGRPLALAMLDVDNFKKLNDTHGHQAGDGALVHLAQIIRDTMRPNDSIARFGGEEFLILLPDSSAEEAAQAVIRLQRNLTKHFFLHDNQKLLITFSAGVTEHAADEPQSEVIARADKGLYQAKAAGKNRVVTILRAPTA